MPSSPTAHRLRTLYDDEHLLVAEYAGICIAVWRGPVTPALFECQRAGLNKVTRANPHSAGFLCVVEDGVMPPPGELRRASATMVREAAADLRRVACVIEAQGFLGSMVRSVLSGMQVLAGRKANVTGFFADVASAADWLAEALPCDAELFTQLLSERRKLPTSKDTLTSRR